MQFKNKYKILFFVIVAFYALFLSRFGFENWDSGFISGFSWRILNGEHIYKDFWYIRPPLSAYFHAFFMQILPETGQYFLIRIIGYCLFAIQVFFAVSGFDNFYNLRQKGIDKWALTAMCFVTSIHNFFGNPWFNNDGIFFAAAAFYLLSKYRKLNIPALSGIAVCCFLSALAKQSFYPVPVLFLLWIWIDSGFRKAFTFGIFQAILLAILVSWLTTFTDLHAALLQISEHSKLSDVYAVGFQVYIHVFHSKIVFATVLLTPALLLFVNSKNQKIQFADYFKWLSVVLFTASVLSLALYDVKSAATVFFNAVIAALIYRIDFKISNIRKLFPLIVLTGIAWCVALSLGYATPVLFCTGLILVSLELMWDFPDFARFKRYLTGTAVAISIFVFSLNVRPYRENFIWNMNCPLGSVSPKLKFIVSSRETSEKYSELKLLIQKYGSDYITAPAIPLSHYLFNTKSPLPADWLTNFETNGKWHELLKISAKKDRFIFLEKSFLKGEEFIASDEDRHNFSEYAVFVHQNLKPVEETNYFLVYNANQLSDFRNKSFLK